MVIILKIFLSIFAYIVLGVFGALAFSAPISKNKNEKVENIKQIVIFYSVYFIVLYYIWTF